MRRASIVVLLAAGCAASGPHPRSLHYVDGELVHSRPASSASYEAYLRARLALSVEPPHLDVAQAEIELALRFDGRDPHLWTTQAEIARRAGDDGLAMTAARQALALQPGYAPAKHVIARVQGGERAVKR